MIEFKQTALHYHYDDYAVLKNLTFTLKNGINTVLCDSQSGKSSICKLLTKQFKPTSGQILIDGEDIASITNEALGILYLSNNPAFFINRSLKYNVTYPLKVRKMSKSERNKRFCELSQQFQLPCGDLKIRKMQQSELKRVALARGSTVERKIVLLDDFCESIEEIEEVARLFANAIIVVFTSNIGLVEGNVVVLDGGNTVYQGDVDGAIKCKSNLSWIVDML